MRQRRNRLRVVLRKVFRRVVYSRSSAQSVAAGAALGILVAFTPTVGVQMIIAAFLATLFRVNRLAAVLPVWITNPLTIVPIYGFEFLVGRWAWPSAKSLQEVERSLETFAQAVSAVSIRDLWGTMGAALSEMGGLGSDILIPLIVGGLICGVVGAALTYPAALWAVTAVRRRRELRSVRKAEERIESLKAAGLFARAGGSADHAGDAKGTAEGDAEGRAEADAAPVGGAAANAEADYRPRVVRLPPRANGADRKGPLDRGGEADADEDAPPSRANGA